MLSIGQRKLLVSLVILIVGVVISVTKGDLPPHLLQLMEVIFGGFIVGNVGEHLVNGSVSKVQIKAATPTPTPTPGSSANPLATTESSESMAQPAQEDEEVEMAAMGGQQTNPGVEAIVQQLVMSQEAQGKALTGLQQTVMQVVQMINQQRRQ